MIVLPLCAFLLGIKYQQNRFAIENQNIQRTFTNADSAIEKPPIIISPLKDCNIGETTCDIGYTCFPTGNSRPCSRGQECTQQTSIGDNKCHKQCQKDVDCSSGQLCENATVWFGDAALYTGTICM